MMARPEDDPRAALRREEGALAEFFDAARAGRADMPPRLVAAMLADAAAARLPAPRPPARPAPRRIVARRRLSAGARVATLALAGCFAIGVLAGALGAGAGIVDPVLWPDEADGATATAGYVDGVDGFFDLALAEG